MRKSRVQIKRARFGCFGAQEREMIPLSLDLQLADT